MTEVTEITIIPIKPKNGLLALASCVVDKKFYLGSIGIYNKFINGYRVTYPNKKNLNNTINIYHPITREAGDAIEKAVVSKYLELIVKDMDLYD